MSYIIYLYGVSFECFYVIELEIEIKISIQSIKKHAIFLLKLWIKRVYLIRKNLVNHLRKTSVVTKHNLLEVAFYTPNLFLAMLLCCFFIFIKIKAPTIYEGLNIVD